MVTEMRCWTNSHFLLGNTVCPPSVDFALSVQLGQIVFSSNAAIFLTYVAPMYISFGVWQEEETTHETVLVTFVNPVFSLPSHVALDCSGSDFLGVAQNSA
jgi:hypothetical protein